MRTIIAIMVSALTSAVCVYGVDLDANHGIILSDKTSGIVTSFETVPVDGGVPVLNSRPGAPNTIYLDFDGEVVTGNSNWNRYYGKEVIHFPPFGGPEIQFDHDSGTPFFTHPPDDVVYSGDDDSTTFNAAEQMAIIGEWQAVAEIYRPFNVNVTTVRPPGDLYNRSNKIAVVLMTRNFDMNDPEREPLDWALGRALFRGVGFAPALSLQGDLSYGRKMADQIGHTAAHEVGHLLGLSHDANSNHPSSFLTNAVMGSNSHIWSRGEYPTANNKEDDMAIIASQWGYAPDDHENTVEGATEIIVPTTSGVSQEGEISHPFDSDVFSFEAVSPFTEVRVRSFSKVPFHQVLARILEPAIDLLDAEGNVVASSNIGYRTSLEIMRIHTIPGTRYYFRVRGDKVDKLDLSSGPYSTPEVITPMYGSVGSYLMTVKAHDYYLPLAYRPRVGDPLRLEVRTRPGCHSFQWSKNGIPIPGATAAILTKENFSTEDMGRYSVAFFDPSVSRAVTATTIVRSSVFHTSPIYYERVGQSLAFPRDGSDYMEFGGGTSNGGSSPWEAQFINTEGIMVPTRNAWDPTENYWRWLDFGVSENGETDAIPLRIFKTNALLLDGIGTLPDWADPTGDYVQVSTPELYDSYTGKFNPQHRYGLKTTGQVTTYPEGTDNQENTAVMNSVTNAVRISRWGNVAFIPSEAGKPVMDNDNIGNRKSLVTGVNKGTNMWATQEDGEPTHAGGTGSVWWQWTAEETGEYVITTRASTFDTTLAVYSGSSLDSLAEVASNDDANGPGLPTSEVRVAAAKGTTYLIAVAGRDGDQGEIRLHVERDDLPLVPSSGPGADQDGPEITLESPDASAPLRKGDMLEVSGRMSDQAGVYLTGATVLHFDEWGGVDEREEIPLELTADGDGYIWKVSVAVKNPPSLKVQIYGSDNFANRSSADFDFQVTDKVTVTFLPPEPTAGRVRGIKGSGEMELVAGKTYTLVAQAASGMLFQGWIINGELLSTSKVLDIEFEDGMEIEADFAPSPFGPFVGSYHGLIVAPGNATIENYPSIHGAIDLSLSGDGRYSGTLRVNGGRQAVRGEFSAGGLSRVTFRDGRVLDLVFDLTSSRVAASTGGLEGTMRRRVGFATGNYTLLMIPPDDSTSGYGYAMFSFKKGVARIAGRLPDGKTWRGNAPFLNGGEVMVFSESGKGWNAGLANGMLAVGGAPGQEIGGVLSYFCGINPKAKTYRQGFSAIYQVAGGLWNSPPKGISILSGGTADTDFTFRCDAGQIVMDPAMQIQGTWKPTNLVQWDDPNEPTRISVSTKSAVFSGRISALDALTSETRMMGFRGIILPTPFDDGSRLVHGAGQIGEKSISLTAPVELTSETAE